MNSDSRLVDLMEISTPRERCFTLLAGRLDPVQVADLTAKRFDQAPVLDEQGALCGLIALEQARALVASGLPVERHDPKLRLREVSGRAPLFDLLAALAEERAVVFRDDARGADWFGLVTISDLNLHQFRAYLYPLLAELEAELAKLIEGRFGDESEWLYGLPEYTQVGIMGRYAFDCSKSIETTLVAGCMLSDLLEVLSKHNELIVRVGFDSKSSFDVFAKRAKALRNDVMHAVRPLVWSTEGVSKLRDTLVRAKALTERLKELNAVAV